MTVTLPYLPSISVSVLSMTRKNPRTRTARPCKRAPSRPSWAQIHRSDASWWATWRNGKGEKIGKRLGKIWKKKDLIDKTWCFSHERRNVETRFRLRRWGFNPAIFGVEGFVVAPQHAWNLHLLAVPEPTFAGGELCCVACRYFVPKTESIQALKFESWFITPITMVYGTYNIL